MLGTSSLVPIVHAVQLYGFKHALRALGVKWYLVELALYGSGVIVYGVGHVSW